MLKPLLILALTPLLSSLQSSAQTATVAHGPQEFNIGRRTFFDFGPPFNFYEIFVVRQNGPGATIVRINATPPAGSCGSTAEVEYAFHNTDESPLQMLANRDPCLIPAKALKHENKRCKKCLAFSGEVITIQVTCENKTRLLSVKVLDQDLFDQNPSTPNYTSETMRLVSHIEESFPNPIQNRVVFPATERSQNLSTTPDLKSEQSLSAGKFDVLFQGAPETPSAIYKQSQDKTRSQSVSLLRSDPVPPISSKLPSYPPIARAARVSGEIALSFEIGLRGEPTQTKILTGPPLLRSSVLASLQAWRYAPELAGQEVNVTISFKLDCQ